MVENGGEKSQMKYAIIIEKGPKNYGAYAPDVPGCIATGSTPAIVQRRMTAAIKLHIASLREHGEPIPKPTTIAAYASIG